VTCGPRTITVTLSKNPVGLLSEDDRKSDPMYLRPAYHSIVPTCIISDTFAFRHLMCSIGSLYNLSSIMVDGVSNEHKIHSQSRVRRRVTIS